ncbi:condensin-2 complex subunit D3 [Pelomyxa schiedti]|nr:condensin-2 complex subunit D3 [Pelomyxa schiedti]
MVEFVVPAKEEDLAKGEANNDEDNEGGPFSVKSVEEPSSGLRKKLNEVSRRLSSNACSIRDNENFDVLYSYLWHFSAVPVDIKQKVLEIACDGLKSVATQLHRMQTSSSQSQSQDGEDQEEMFPLKNALQMYTFLLSWMVKILEKDALTQTAAAEKSAKGKRTKKDVESNFWSELGKEKVLGVMIDTLEADLARVWKAPQPEERFLQLFTRTCFTLVENPSVTRLKQVRRSLTVVLGVLVKQYSQWPVVMTSMINLMHQYEHVPEMFSEIVSCIASEFKCHQCVGSILREISKMNPRDLGKETTLLRNLAEFISNLSALAPTNVLPCVSVLRPHLDGEHHIMRNGVLQTFTTLILRGTQTSEDDTEKVDPTVKEELLDTLLQRIHDVSGYTRSKVLQLWCSLLEERAVPLSMLSELLKMTCGRLQDKISAVRKSAVQLLISLLKWNPYGPTLKLSEFRKKIEEYNALLQASCGEQESSSGSESEETGPDQPHPKKRRVSGDAHTVILKDIDQQRLINLLKDSPYDSVDVSLLGQILPQLKKFGKWARDTKKFIEILHKALPSVSALLESKISTDVLEAIEFFVVANEFQIEEAKGGLRRMLMLVWSSEPGIKEALTNAYNRLFLGLSDPIAVSRSLIGLTQGATLGELTSLEEVVTDFVFHKYITPKVLDSLWRIFVPHITANESCGALMILGMAANADPSIILKKINVVVNIGLGPRWKEEDQLARYSCIALQKLRQTKPPPQPSDQKKKKKAEKEASASKVNSGSSSASPVISRLESSHNLFQKLLEVITYKNVPLLSWFPVAEQVINTIYTLCEKPEIPSVGIVKSLYKEAFQETQVMTSDLCKFFFVLGQIAIKQLALIEELVQLASSKSVDTKKEKGSPKKDIEQELGSKEAHTESKYEAMQLLAERQLVSTNLLGEFASLIVTVCRNATGQFGNSLLRESAVLALCKYMCVSSEFCAEHIHLLVSILASPSEPASVRSNVIITIGDLCFRFPNVVEPYTDHIYKTLRDSDSRVRKNALLVLTHLILHDMIKIKGQISEIAMLLTDSDTHISELTRLFFNELSTKGNSIYNILPDVISSLLSSEAENFKDVVKFLFSFLSKERQFESLLEKLCQRIKIHSDPHHSRCISYCLSLLTYNDKCIRKLGEQFPCYRDKLDDDEVYECYCNIVNKTKKFAKPELKAELDNFEKKLIAAREHTEYNPDQTPAPSAASGTAKARGATQSARGRRRGGARAATTTGKRKAPAKRKVESDSDSESAASFSSSEEQAPARKATTTKKKSSSSSSDQRKVDNPAASLEDSLPASRRCKVVHIRDRDSFYNLAAVQFTRHVPWGFRDGDLLSLCFWGHYMQVDLEATYKSGKAEVIFSASDVAQAVGPKSLVFSRTHGELVVGYRSVTHVRTGLNQTFSDGLRIGVGDFHIGAASVWPLVKPGFEVFHVDDIALSNPVAVLGNHIFTTSAQIDLTGCAGGLFLQHASSWDNPGFIRIIDTLTGFVIIQLDNTSPVSPFKVQNF